MTDPPDEKSRPDEQDEVSRLNEEVAVLRSQVDTRARRHRRVTTLRKVVAAVLVALAAFGVTASVIGVWGARTTLNTDRWVSTVGPLADDPQVQAAVTTYMTTQLYDTLDVPTRVKNALPPKAAFLAAPLSTRVKDFIHDAVNKVVTSDQFAALWPQLNRLAHEKIMAIVNNESAVIKQSGDTATLNLLPVVNEVLRQLEQQAPTLFGKTLNLPPVTSGQVPPELKSRIESALGVTLPSNFGKITIYKGKELKAAQDAVVAFKKGVLALVIGSFVLLALALAVSPQRRRTALQLGVWLAIFTVALTTVLRGVRDQVLGKVPAGVYRDGASSAMHIVFTTLRQRGTQLIWLGIIIALVAYLVGPGRGAVAVRGWTARGARAVAGATRRGASVTVAEGPGFARAHLDALRIGGVVVAAVVVFLSLSWTGLLVVAIVLAAYEVLVTLVAGSAPEPAPAVAGGEVPGQRAGQETAIPAGRSEPRT